MADQEANPQLVDDLTILDGDDQETTQGKPTPLPKFQLAIAFMIMFIEPVTAEVIYPFVNQFVRDTGITKGDETKTGYYAGTIESMFFLAECLTVVQWGYLSDKFGRRTILLFGPLGLAISMLAFGLSTTFWPIVVFRALQGVFNGNIGVAKSVIAEMTDASNIGDAYALIPLMWSCGSTLGPIIGGVLSNPAKRWPDTLGRIAFLRTHPYFLPCATAAAIAFVTFMVALFGLKETLPSIVAKQKLDKQKRDGLEDRASNSETPLLNHGQDVSYGTGEETRPEHPNELSETPTLVAESNAGTKESQDTSLRAALTRPILLIFLSYIFLTFIDMCHFVLVPLMYSTPLEYGGLGLDPFQIGVALALSGVVASIIQAKLLGPIMRKYGSRRIYQVGFSGIFVGISMYPIMKYFANRAGGVDAAVVVCIAIQLGLMICAYAAYGSIQVLLVQCIPEGGPLGTTNGMAQMLSSGMRTVAPTFASSLFAVSASKRLAGGNMVYYVLMGLELLGMWAALQLPHPLKQKEKSKSRQASS